MKLPKRKVKTRIGIIMIFICAVFMILVGRVAWLQTIDGAMLKKAATQQQTRDNVITSKRGTIYDRNNKELAVSASVEMVTASPREVKEGGDVELVAKELAEILSLSYDDVYKKITKESSYEIIKRKVESEQTDKIRKLKADDDTKKAFAGIRLEEDTKRYYPYGSFASHILGFTGTDNQGLYGIENAYDDELSGVAGRVISVKNAAGVDMPFKYEQKFDSKDGLNVVLTIDETIQHFAEKHLEQAYEENLPAKGAFAIVIAPKTGEVLAMATKPDFDLNSPYEITSQEILDAIGALPSDKQSEAKNTALYSLWKNKAVTDTYEPGSVFKILTYAMALEEGVTSPSDTFNCTGGLKVGPYTIHCWKREGHNHETLKQGLENSCNPVLMELGSRLGVDTFRKYFSLFGMNAKTGFDLVGETSGVFFGEGAMHEVELATCTFGQSFQVTPLQLAAAISAVVNGGNLYRPHIVKALTDENGAVVKNYEPELVRKIVSEKTSEIMRDFLEGVVANGTGKGARIDGYRIGGKTGTSEKQPRGEGKYVASFLGVAPADDPELLCIVAIDEPTGDLYQGSQIAAPVVRNILEDTLRYMGIEKKLDSDKATKLQSNVPEIRGFSVDEAKKQLVNEGFSVRIIGEGDMAMQQLPKPGASLAKGSTVIIYTTEGEVEKVAVPDVVGMSLSDVRLALSNAGLNVEVLGAAEDSSSSPANKQDPPAGSMVTPATTIRVEFIYLDGD